MEREKKVDVKPEHSAIGERNTICKHGIYIPRI